MADIPTESGWFPSGRPAHDSGIVFFHCLFSFVESDQHQRHGFATFGTPERIDFKTGQYQSAPFEPEAEEIFILWIGKIFISFEQF